MAFRTFPPGAEAVQPRHPSEPRARAGRRPPGTRPLLRAAPALPRHAAVLRSHAQRRAQELPQHGRRVLRLPLSRDNCLVTNLVVLTGKTKVHLGHIGC